MRKTFSIILSIVVTLGLLYVLLQQVSLPKIIESVGSLHPLSVLFGFVLYIFVQLFRSLRTRFLLRGQLTLKELFPITCVHNAMINILPARTGELSYVYLLKRSGQNVGTGVGTLALSRVFDLLAMSIWFGVAALLVSDLPQVILDARLPILIALAAVIVILMLIVIFNEQTVILLNALFKKMNWKDNKFCQWTLAKAEETLHSLHVMKSWKPVVGALLCSLGVWAFLFLINFVIFSGIGITKSLVLVVLASSVSSILGSIPIQGIAGLGTTEAYWTVALIGIGIAPELAVVAGFTQHLIALLYIFTLGIFGTWLRPQ